MDDAEVVGDQHHAERRARGASSASSSRICAWIVTSSAVVGSSAITSFGSHHQRHRQHDPLAHAARELVGVVVERGAPRSGCSTRSSISTARWRASSLPMPLVRAHRLDDLLADRERGIERSSSAPGRPSTRPCRGPAHVPPRRATAGRRRRGGRAPAADAAPPGGKSRISVKRGHRLAAAALADDAEHLAVPHSERNVVDRVEAAGA